MDKTSPITRGTILVDKGNEYLANNKENILSVPVDDTWYVVQPWESIVFVDKNGNNWFNLILYTNEIFITGQMLLVVLREIGSQRPDIQSYVTSVVKEAVRDRKTVRVSD